MEPKGSHRAGSASERIISRLRSDPVLARLIPTDARVESGHPSGWRWIISTEEYHFGSDSTRAAAAEAPGLAVDLICFDQIEVTPIDTPGTRLGWVLESRLKTGAFGPAAGAVETAVPLGGVKRA